MDMELQRMRLGGFRPVYDALIRQEETLESIVPDALPDIARIVASSGSVLLRQKETVDGSVRVMGSVRLSILYLPEQGGPACTLALNLPFLCSGDNPDIRSGCQAQVSAGVISADARMLNPRKVLARVEIAVGVAAYEEEQEEITAGAKHGGEGLQLLQETHRDFAAVDLVEKYFAFSDVVRIPASRPGMEKFLSARTELSCTEARVIGKKLVVKGEAVLAVLYQSETGVSSARFELPFSQIAETRAAGEECGVLCEVVLTGIDCAPRGESELEISVEALFQAAVVQEREVALLADLYSTGEPLETDRRLVTLSQLGEQGTRRQMTRQFCPTQVPAHQVVDCGLTMGEVGKVPAGEGGMMVTARAYVDIVYLSEDGGLHAAAFTIPASCELPIPGKSQCRCRCRPVGEVSAMPVTDGLEVRFEAEFSFLATQPAQAFCVSAVRPGQGEPCAAGRPSVILRMMGEGERLWDIAKCCASTVADIRAANAMDGGEPPGGTLLLIPTCK